MWGAEVLTLYPEIFPANLGSSVIGRALRDKLWGLRTINLRDYGLGVHGSVDAPPYGGGGGMILRVDVIGAAVGACSGDYKRLYLSPSGRRIEQSDILSWSKLSGIILLCGHFGGVDYRVVEGCGFEAVSLCDFVLSGGEVAALSVIEGCVRLLPDVLGNESSLMGESFSFDGGDGGDGGSRIGLQHVQYTRPEIWDGLSVPRVLLSGDHNAIREWRLASSQALTRKNRS